MAQISGSPESSSFGQSLGRGDGAWRAHRRRDRHRSPPRRPPRWLSGSIPTKPAGISRGSAQAGRRVGGRAPRWPPPSSLFSVAAASISRRPSGISEGERPTKGSAAAPIVAFDDHLSHRAEQPGRRPSDLPRPATDDGRSRNRRRMTVTMRRLASTHHVGGPTALSPSARPSSAAKVVRRGYRRRLPYRPPPGRPPGSLPASMPIIAWVAARGGRQVRRPGWLSTTSSAATASSVGVAVIVDCRSLDGRSPG